jgi:MFS family permease
VPRAVSNAVVTPSELPAWTRPRGDLLDEHQVVDEDGRAAFECRTGPFRSYRRSVTWDDRDGRVELHQEVDYTLALPVWSALYALPIRRRLRRPPGAKAPWWAPSRPIDERSADVMARLCTLSVISGYLGTVISQTITFASDEFDASTRTQGTVLALTRIGVLFALVLLAVADRQGRRRILLWGTAAACVFTVLGAASPTLWSLGVSQTIARGITTGMGLLLIVVAAEEVSAGARAYAVSVLALAAALGSGMAVWILPLADLGESAWRILYLVPALALPVVVAVGRRLPETRRFVAARAKVNDARAPVPAGRLALLAATAFLVLAFRTPASQLQNEFLREHRGYSAASISLFTIVTATPAGLGVLIGGRIADLRGRRGVSAVGLVGGALCMTIAVSSYGWQMWVWELVGVVIASLTVPALGSYGPELFATRMRGRANGIVAVAGVIGSSLGLVVAGELVDRWSFGVALGALAVGPLVAAVLVLARYPETANLELEALNPDDEGTVGDAPTSAAGATPDDGHRR